MGVNRQASVSLIPSSSSLVMKALNEPVRDRKKVKNVVHDGNITLDQVIDIARQMRERSMAKKLSGSVKEMLGTCFSIGCTVNDESPRDIQSQIDDGEIEIPEELMLIRQVIFVQVLASEVTGFYYDLYLM